MRRAISLEHTRKHKVFTYVGTTADGKMKFVSEDGEVRLEEPGLFKARRTKAMEILHTKEK